MLHKILLAAIIAGVLTGSVFTVFQQVQVIPLIHAAEAYETTTHDHQDAHDSGENMTRQLFTLLANVLAGISFSLLLASAITLSKQTGWRKGLLWGVAGYLSFFVAPSLGLSPKLPGTFGAPLEQQQIWWIATVSATAIGLGLLVFNRFFIIKALGFVFILMPHIIGAPLPQQPYSPVPVHLSQEFIVASAVVNAVFWIILGALSGYLLRKTDDAR